MGAGRREHRVAFWRATTTRSAAGQAQQAWAAIPDGEAYAAVYFGKGEERREAGRLDVAQTVSFVVPSNAMTRALTEADRIAAFGSFWDIAAPGIPIGRADLEFTAKRAGPVSAG